jgi:hypothetical protein
MGQECGVSLYFAPFSNWLTVACTPRDRNVAFAPACGLHGAVHGFSRPYVSYLSNWLYMYLYENRDCGDGGKYSVLCGKMAVTTTATVLLRWLACLVQPQGNIGSLKNLNRDPLGLRSIDFHARKKPQRALPTSPTL